MAEDEPLEDEPDTELRDTAAEHVDRVRSEEVDQRLALRTAEERARAIAGRADTLRRQASSERQARARAAAARRRTGARARRSRAWSSTPGDTACDADRGVARPSPPPSGTRSQSARAERESARTPRPGDATNRLTALLEKLTDAVHRDEVARAESRMRLEQLTEKVLADHGIGVDDLVAEYGPDVPVPPSDAETAEYEAARERGEQVSAPPPMPYDRADPGATRARAPRRTSRCWAR